MKTSSLSVLSTSLLLGQLLPAQTIWGTSGGSNSDIYRVDPNTGVVSAGYNLPNTPGGSGARYQGIAHYRRGGSQDKFFMTSYFGAQGSSAIADQATIYNAQSYTPTIHLFDSATGALNTFDLTTIAGYNASWFNQGPNGATSSKPWLNSGGGYYDGSVYITTEYFTNLGGGNNGFTSYDHLLKLDLNAAGDGFTGMSRILINSTSGLPTTPAGLRTFGDTGDIDFIEDGPGAGRAFNVGISYNNGSGNTLGLERVSYRAGANDLGNGQTFVTNNSAQFPSPWGFDGVTELNGQWFASGAANGAPGSAGFIDPRLYRLDDNGNILSSVQLDASDLGFSTFILNDLTSSYPVPEPSGVLLSLLSLAGLAFRRSR